LSTIVCPNLWTTLFTRLTIKSLINLSSFHLFSVSFNQNRSDSTKIYSDNNISTFENVMNHNDDDFFSLPSYAIALEIEKQSGCVPVRHLSNMSNMDNKVSSEDLSNSSDNNDTVNGSNMNSNSNNNNANRDNISHDNVNESNININSNTNNSDNNSNNNNSNNMEDSGSNNNGYSMNIDNNIYIISNIDSPMLTYKENSESSELSRTFHSGMATEDLTLWDESAQSPPPEYDEFPGGPAFVQAEILRTISSNLNKLTRHIK
jgi:hypothetical protein